MANTNYGTLLKRESVTIAGVVSIDPPELENESVEVTNHGSGGFREYISGGLKGAGEFSCGLNYVQTAVSGIYNDFSSGTVGEYSITFPNNIVWSFDALVTKYKAESADAQSPEALQLTVTFQPTGEISLA